QFPTGFPFQKQLLDFPSTIAHGSTGLSMLLDALMTRNTHGRDPEEGFVTPAKYKRPLLIHAERIPEGDDHDLQDDELDPRSYMTYLKSRPPSCGASLSIETCPHYMAFSSEEVPDGDTRFKCSPPIRDDTNRENLWKALLVCYFCYFLRVIHVNLLSSDHSPSTPDLKLMEEGDFLRFVLPTTWSYGRKYGITLNQLASWWSERPAKLAGQKNKGAILPGYHADIVVWKPKTEFQLDNNHAIYHKHQ
ncbi:hypothetical protein ACJX0J_036447, partial [Zea mays]